LILGLGETEQELIQTMKDLRESQCDILTLGQYLAPSIEHYPIIEFISPAQFQRYQDLGLALGFRSVLSGPKVRSSYRAEEVFTYA
jgi:lipoic acid synthetase